MCSQLFAWEHVENWWLIEREARKKQGTRGQQQEQEKGEKQQSADSGGRKDIRLKEVLKTERWAMIRKGCRRQPEYQDLFS